jgi:hypothetical protein
LTLDVHARFPSDFLFNDAMSPAFDAHTFSSRAWSTHPTDIAKFHGRIVTNKSTMENVQKVQVPFKKNEAWQTLFFGKRYEDVVKEINSIWLANSGYEIILQKKPVSNPNQLNFIFEEPNHT